ncbi:MAG: integrating conjugative element protein [Pseudomonadota bacterium]
MAKKFSYGWNGSVLIGLALTPVLAWSQVTVIYHSGDTRPLAPYLEVFNGAEPITKRPPMRGSKLGAADVRVLLPIRSPGLSPGPVQAKPHDRPFSRPFFLIGSDERSRQWLVKHRDRLQTIGAVGMLVQAESPEDLRAIAGLSGGLSIMPASATDIAAALGIAHYPVLITSRGIEQ